MLAIFNDMNDVFNCCMSVKLINCHLILGDKSVIENLWELAGSAKHFQQMLFWAIFVALVAAWIIEF